MKSIVIYLSSFLLFWSVSSSAQSSKYSFTDKLYKEKFISISLGAQISGIKKEDFIRDNVSPSFSLSSGIWIRPGIGVSLSYKGPYFYTIADKVRHNYSYFFCQTLINLDDCCTSINFTGSKLNIIPHCGYGIFYNAHYEGVQVNGNIGLMLCRQLRNNIQIYIDFSSVLGWDIYQGNEDILPSAAFGLIIDMEE